MSGWVPFDAAAWPEVAQVLANARPWPEGAAAFHLRWLKDRYPDRALPGRPSLRVLFGWTDWKVRSLLASGDWHDPKGGSASAPPAGRQRSASAPPATARANLDNGADSASAPPALRQPAASGPPQACRSHSHSHSHSQNKQTSPPAGWDALCDVYQEQIRTLGHRARKLNHGKGQGKVLAARLAEHGLADVSRVLRWWATSMHPRAAYLRSNGYGLTTLCRQSKFEGYLALSDSQGPPRAGQWIDLDTNDTNDTEKLY